MHASIPSVTVAIPAYNEENNIGHLLRQIATQKENEIRIVEILVYSDGSSDQTVSSARAVQDERIRVIDGGLRKGVNAALNVLVRQAKGDFLALLNADIVLANPACIEEMVAPLLQDSTIGLSSAVVDSLPAKTYFERVMKVSHTFKLAMYEASFPTGDTPYLCHGRARSFSRSFYEKISWPEQCPEDSYSYFFAQAEGYGFVYTRSAKIFFRSPATFADFSKQSHRFQWGKKMLYQYFDTSSIQLGYRLLLWPTLRVILQFMVRFPEAMLVYFLSLASVRFLTWGKPTEQSRWQISSTSKDVI